MSKYGIATILFSIQLLTLGFIVFNFLPKVVLADTSTKSATIKASVPSSGGSGGGGGGGGGSSVNPTIKDVSSTPSQNSAVVSWVATDNTSIAKCEFSYDKNKNYSKSQTPKNPSGDKYRVELNNLSVDTKYYYKIKCTDSSSQTETKSGSFKTLDYNKIDLTLHITPENRVNNNHELKFYLFIVDPKNSNTMLKITSTTNKNGKFSVTQIRAATGSNLTAYIKGRSHLADKITGVDISDGKDVKLNLPTTLKAGDVSGTGLKDNFIDVLDLSALTNKINTNNKEADLNRDGVVDVLDISILFNNFNKQGGKLPKHLSI